MTVLIELCAIRVDERAQPRAGMNYATVKEFAEDLRNGAEFPPVVVFQDSEGACWLADGFHRVTAVREAGREEIEAEVKQGTLRDAILYSVGANATHGMRRTNEDKRYAVLRLLQDAEWRKWSDREIARRCAVGHAFVSSLRSSLSTKDSEEPAAKTYTTKHGTQATMDTTQIGRGQKPTSKPEPKAQQDRRHDTDPEIAIQMILDRVRIVFDGIKSLSARHEVVNALIKHFRDVSVEMNRKAM